MVMADDQRYMKLRPEFLAGFDWRKAGVSRQAFAEWARKKREPPLRVDERNWSPLKAGQPVPWEMVEALSEYLIDILKLKDGKDNFRLVQMAEHCDAPRKSEKGSDSGLNAWRLNFAQLFTLKTSSFTIPPEAYCRGESDIMDAALMVMHAIGYRATKSPSKEVCINYSVGYMKRTPGEYARLLLDAWKANEHAVLFTIQRHKDGTTSRLGVSTTFPLTKRCFDKFRSGETVDIALTHSDMQKNSIYLLIAAVTENAEIDLRKEKGRRSMGELNTLLYQLAALCPSLNSWTVNPTLVSHASEPESIERLKSYQFKPVGTRTTLTDLEVVEFAPPAHDKLKTATPLDFAHYLALKSILLIYQYVRINNVVPEE
jgi:hypothetical protein